MCHPCRPVTVNGLQLRLTHHSHFHRHSDHVTIHGVVCICWREHCLVCTLPRGLVLERMLQHPGKDTTHVSGRRCILVGSHLVGEACPTHAADCSVNRAHMLVVADMLCPGPHCVRCCPVGASLTAGSCTTTVYGRSSHCSTRSSRPCANACRTCTQCCGFRHRDT